MSLSAVARRTTLAALVLLVGCGAIRIGDTEADGGSAGSKGLATEVVFPAAPVTVKVELAQTDAQRSKGLGGHAPLGDRDGMLFIFEQPGFYGFWMKGMTFALDIMWIDQGRVIHLEQSLPPPGPGDSDATRPVYGPRAAARYVLEVNAGFAKKYGITEGSEVQLKGVAGA